MMTERDELVDCLEARMAGQSPQIPESVVADLELALTAHRALRDLLDTTPALPPTSRDRQTLPALADRYEIVRELGRGGMGVVYLARQLDLNRHVAIKVLRAADGASQIAVDRFRDEARHLAQLKHPGIVTIHEVGEAEGEPYFTMDYIEGQSLAVLLAGGPLPPSQAVAILRQVTEALQHAHRQGIIHRDLKPGNVLVEPGGHAYVTDFGLARDVRRESQLTQSGEMLGTPQYMAPEQARGETHLVGEATDLHALGLLLFEMLTGQSPYAARTPADVLVKLLNETPPLLRSIDRRIPRDLETMTARLLEKQPGDRYANAGAVLEDLRRYEAGEPLLAQRTSLWKQGRRWLRRHAKLVGTAVATFLLSMVVLSQWFEPPVAELLRWGDEELASGNPEQAAPVYLRAFRRATPAEQSAIAQRIVTTCRQMADAPAAVGLALEVIDLVPDASFAQHDYLIAQALVARERADDAHGRAALNPWQGKPQERLELVRSRLERALAQQLSDDQRRDAEETLANVKLALSPEGGPVRYAPEFLHELPTDEDEVLQATLDDQQAPAWNRGRAAMVLAERAGEGEEAIARYRQAYDLLRQVYPGYEGFKAAMGNTRDVLPDAEECQLVRRLAEKLHKLDPTRTPEPAGGLTWQVVGVPLTGDVALELVVQLCDPAVPNPDAGLPHSLPRLVLVTPSRRIEVGVLDGTYRLRLAGYHLRTPSGQDKLQRLLQVDSDAWPKEVKIAGDEIELPAVRLRMAAELALEHPAEGTAVALKEAEFAWQEMPKAARYQVRLAWHSESPHLTTSYFHTLTTTEPRLRLADLEGHDRQTIIENWIVGRTASWSVDAYDADDKLIGRSLAEPKFLVAEGLE